MKRQTKSVFKPGDFSLKVRRSRTGLGLFTETPIARGACIIEYIGRPATKKEIREDKGKYLFWNSDTTMIDGNIPKNTARYINHACESNCEVRLRARRIYVFATRDIHAGEELNYDYGPEYFDKHIRPKGCLCTNCQGSAIMRA